MINFRIIARVFSLLLIFEGLFMLASAGVSEIYGEHAATAFLFSGIITMVTGAIVFSPLRNEERVYSNKEGYIIVTGTWLLFALFGTLPFILSGSIKSFGDAFFESMSGFTTTGATILTNIESMPHGILFWRSLTQWMGGLGVIFLSLSLFPVVHSIKIQLAATEFSGQSPDKIHPRIKDTAKRLIFIYTLITLLEAVFLMAGGMSPFDAICHSFSTMSTGGFSTRNDGIASFNSPYITIIITVFMFIAGINTTLIYYGLKGNFRKLTDNNEFVLYTLMCVCFILLTAVVLGIKPGYNFGKSLLDGAFHVVSFITTTGFYTHDYNIWGSFLIAMLFILMFTGATSGSASGSIKIVRLLLIGKNNRQELKKLVHPNAFVPVMLDRRIISQSTIANLLVFITLYFLIASLGAFLISFMGYDLVTSFSTSASMLGNIGPGIGKFGPFTNYSTMAMPGKMLMTVLMLIGRLELLTVLVLFTRNFYKT
jgi:trk system potassium uptake protein TrkH